MAQLAEKGHMLTLALKDPRTSAGHWPMNEWFEISVGDACLQINIKEY
jgi:hypothetical protein